MVNQITGGRTDGRTTLSVAIRRFALCSSRGKNGHVETGGWDKVQLHQFYRRE